MQAAARTCRVCLADQGQLSLFDDEAGVKLYVKIMACSAVQIYEEDGFPSYICSVCYSMLNIAFDFKTKCELSDLKLRNCLSKDTLKLESTDYNFTFPDDDIFSDDYCNDEDNDDVKNEFSMDVDVKLFESKSDLDVPKRKVGKHKKKSSLKGVSSAKNAKTKKRLLVKRVVSNSIATSLLEGKCVWNGCDWRFESPEKGNLNSSSEPLIVKKVESEIPQTNRKKGKRKHPNYKQKTVNLCDTCGKTFKSKYHLKYHMVLKHQDTVGTIKCIDPNCKKMFKLDNYMVRHVKRCHSVKREFICNECGKQYAFISGLKQHMKSHSENLVWKHCNYCTQKYRTQKSVDIHVRSVHTGERPSVCKVCASAFFHDDYLKEHMRLHTGETPYKCPICKRGYAQRGNMKSHMKQHRLSELDEATKATLKPNYLNLLRNC